MCGIAGIMYKGKLLGTGQALIDMLDGCQHRGPDSTGFALYTREEEGRLRLRFFVGEGRRRKPRSPASPRRSPARAPLSSPKRGPATTTS